MYSSGWKASTLVTIAFKAASFFPFNINFPSVARAGGGDWLLLKLILGETIALEVPVL